MLPWRLRREELCTLKVRDIHGRRGVLHLRVHGKGGKVRYLPLHPGTAELVVDYLEIAGHAGETAGALFRPVKNNTGGTMEGAITADGIYKMEMLCEVCGGEHRGLRRALTPGHGGHQPALQSMVTKNNAGISRAPWRTRKISTFYSGSS